MRFQENGLEISVFPPEGEKIAPNTTSQTRVNITNKRHEAGIRIEVSVDLPSELQKWCKNPNHKITIAYQKSQEIDFLWQIPQQAIPGTYNYNLRIRFLRSTSFYAVQPKRRQLTVLRTKVKPQVNNIEPSFAITPASSSTKPIILASRETLNLEIDVHNRSNKTDNFQISTDLETAWYTIRYPETIKRVGAIDGNEALNLNPNKTGKIYLNIKPPADVVAGNYKPEIALYSLNSPDLFLKKILYLNILPQYNIQAELQTILNKVSYKKGQYKIIITNEGNTFRAIELKAYSSDEDELCEYYLEPSLVKIPPNKTREVKLEVEPNSQQKRPFLATKQFNFQVDLIDQKDYPLPKNLPLKSNLYWRSRPFWQTILLLLLILGCIGGIAWVIWKNFLQPAPKPEITFKPEKTEYYYDGEPIAVEWKLKNPETIDKIIIFDQERPQDIINTKCYVFQPELVTENCYLIAQSLNQNNFPDQSYGECSFKHKTINCSEVTFNHAQDVKNYVFTLQAFSATNDLPTINTDSISILPKPTLQIVETLNITPVKTQYQPKERIKLTFGVSDIEKHFEKEDKIFLLINNERKNQPVISYNNINEFCTKSFNNLYSCNINIPPLTDGEYKLGIELQHDPNGRTNPKPERHIAPKTILVQTPIELNYFTVDGSSSSTEVEPDIRVPIKWSVRGNNIKVSLGECGSGPFNSRGTKYISVPEKLTLSCVLTAFDSSGNRVQLGTIKVRGREKPKPEPELPVISPDFFQLPN